MTRENLNMLLIDAGNTRVKWALAEEGAPAGKAWHAAGSVPHAEVAELAGLWRGMPIARVVIANVAGPRLREALQVALDAAVGDMSDKTRPPVEWFVSSAERAGLRNRYRQPAQLGCDRFAAAIGARALYPGRALIVAGCGTATTVDAVSADGEFVGGMILPGLALMTAALAGNTAQLPQVSLQADASHPFADHTDAAIVSGCLAAQAGAIERAVAAYRAAQGGSEVACILTGGAADLIAPQLSVAHERIDNLVLIGLQTVATSSC